MRRLRLLTQRAVNRANRLYNDYHRNDRNYERWQINDEILTTFWLIDGFHERLTRNLQENVDYEWDTVNA